MKLITLYVDVSREPARAIATQVAQAFRARGFEIAIWKGQNQALNIASGDARAEDASLFITIGGDGTLLRAARVATEHDVPLL